MHQLLPLAEEREYWKQIAHKLKEPRVFAADM